MSALWIGLGAIGALVLYLVISSDTASTFGMANSQFAQVALLSMWGAIIATAIIPGRGQFRAFARNAAIWILIILALTAGYIFRFDLQDIASRMTAGLIPGSPRSILSEDGRERVVLSRADGGHFLARMTIDGVTVPMLVDTGASSSVLTERDAEAIGINVSSLNFTIPSQTANGIAYFAKARVNSMQLGAIERRNRNVLIAKGGTLDANLLGMSFLNSLSSFEFRGDELYLSD